MKPLIIRTHQRQQGFTLLELMIVVAVVGILATIAYPNYSDYVRKSRRIDAKNALLEMANRQEQFILNRGTYSANTANLGHNGRSEDGFYTVSVNAETANCPIASCYALTATPVATGPQAADTRCTTFTLNSAGVRGATGTTPNDCW